MATPSMYSKAMLQVLGRRLPGSPVTKGHRFQNALLRAVAHGFSERKHN
jgi:hypothetical protein